MLNPTQQAIMGNILALRFSTHEINKYQNLLVLDTFKLRQYTIVLRPYNLEFFIVYSFKFIFISTCLSYLNLLILFELAHQGNENENNFST